MELLPFLKLNWTWLQIVKKHLFILYWLNNLITALQLILHTVHLMLYEMKVGYYKPREHVQHIEKFNIVVVRCCFKFHVTPRKKWLAWHLPILIILVLIGRMLLFVWMKSRILCTSQQAPNSFLLWNYHDAVFY